MGCVIKFLLIFLIVLLVSSALAALIGGLAFLWDFSESADLPDAVRLAIQIGSIVVATSAVIAAIATAADEL